MKVLEINTIKVGKLNKYPGYTHQRTLYTAKVKGFIFTKTISFMYTEIFHDNGEFEFYWDLMSGGDVPQKLIRAIQWNTTMESDNGSD